MAVSAAGDRHAPEDRSRRLENAWPPILPDEAKAMTTMADRSDRRMVVIPLFTLIEWLSNLPGSPMR
jgi:hypothetical protein